MQVIEQQPQIEAALEGSGALHTSRHQLKDFDGLLSQFRGSHFLYSCWQLFSTTTLFVIGWIACYWSLSYSYFLTLFLCVPTAMLAVRLFIFQHDCGHRSFFPSKKMNDLIGGALGIITFTPYACWRREHAMHHACSGDLDRRGKAGEIYTMTVNEYRNASAFDRLYYRVYRHPLVLFVFGAFYQFVIRQRCTFQVPKTWKRERRGIHLTNLSLLVSFGVLSWLVGPLAVLMVHIPVIAIAAGVGVWLFYIQHQYEEAFWERSEDWDYVEAAMAGSSHYRLPRVLRWFTGNIGLHHIHHLDSRIPNYRLQSCHDSNPKLRAVPEFSLWESFANARLKLWDEEKRQMVSFRDV